MKSLRIHITFLLVFAAAALLSSCSRTEENALPGPGENQGGRVTFALAAETRTSIDEDGRTTRWMPGDQIALWAVDGTGSALTAEPFTLWHFDTTLASAFFTADIEPLPEGTYTYYASCPLPANTEGTTAGFDIPAVQTGTSDISCAVMLARPVEAGALQAGHNPDFGLSFVHRTHILKITVPADKNLLGEPVEKLAITFPEPVAGRLTFDVTDPDAVPVLTDETRTLTLDFPSPVEAGETVWAVIAPADLSAGEIVFRAYSASYESQPISTTGKNFLPGHTTPISLTIPELKVSYLRFSLSGTNNLGEEVTSFTVTAPEGTEFDKGVTSRTFTVDKSNQYALAYKYNANKFLAGKTFGVSFDSPNAQVTSSFVMPETVDKTIYNEAVVTPFDIPYLMFENFSGLTGSPNDNDSGGLINYNATDLSGYNLPGWSISRAAGSGGYCLCLRHYVAIGADYYARINSAPLSHIKEGSKVNLTVWFNGAAASDDVKCIFGSYDTADKRYPGSGDNVQNYSSEQSILKDTAYASYDKMSPDAPQYNFTVSDAGNTTCLSWKTSANLSGLASYKETYIDNIKVSITK